MKKRNIGMLFAVFFILGTLFSTHTVEGATSVKALQKEINSLKGQLSTKNKEIKTLKNVVSKNNKDIKSLKSKLSAKTSEVNKLKRLVPTVSTGKIYKDGVPSGSSSFVTMGGKNYVEIGKIITLLTTYDETHFNFNKNNKNLYLGIQPRNGIINLLNLPIWEQDSYIYPYKAGGISINGKKMSNGIVHGGPGWSFSSVVDYGISYKLNGNYSKFKFKYGLNDQSSENVGEITLLGDGNVIFESGDIARLEDPKAAEVDVSGIKFLTIEFSGDGASYSAVGEPVLIP